MPRAPAQRGAEDSYLSSVNLLSLSNAVSQRVEFARRCRAIIMSNFLENYWN